MTTAADPAGIAAPKKSSRLPLILGIVLAVAGGGGGFMAVRMGLLSGTDAAKEGDGDGGTAVQAASGQGGVAMPPMESAAFVPLDPILVNLPSQTGQRYLRFTAQLEVAPEHQAEVSGVTPRIVDVLNGYLRAVELSDLEDRSALTRLRAQMLRRVQVVTGAGRVRDLLIMEFVLN